jgi:hypothetical protein
LGRITHCFELLFIELRQHRVTIFEGCDNLSRAVLSLVGYCASLSHIFVEDHERTSIAAARLDTFEIIDEVHNTVFDSLVVLSEVITIVKEIPLPL